MTDAVEQLADLTGVSPEDVKRAWEAARQNFEQLEACSAHHFDSTEPVKPGLTVRCKKCGGLMTMQQAAMYATGFRAAGGDPNEVWPAYAVKRWSAATMQRTPGIAEQPYDKPLG
jgi:hypothetical protein